MDAKQLATLVNANQVVGAGTISENNLATAVAIALAESDGNPDATSPNPDGGVNVGIWQLDTKGAGKGHTVAELKDPNVNADVAATASNNWTDFGEWATYKSGKYKQSQYWSPAQAAAKGTNRGINPHYGGSGPLAGLASIGDFFGRLTDAHTWVRIGEVVLGLVLIAVAVARITHAVPIATRVAKTAGAVALV